MLKRMCGSQKGASHVKLGGRNVWKLKTKVTWNWIGKVSKQDLNDNRHKQLGVSSIFVRYISTRWIADQSPCVPLRRWSDSGCRATLWWQSSLASGWPRWFLRVTECWLPKAFSIWSGFQQLFLWFTKYILITGRKWLFLWQIALKPEMLGYLDSRTSFHLRLPPFFRVRQLGLKAMVVKTFEAESQHEWYIAQGIANRVVHGSH